MATNWKLEGIGSTDRTKNWEDESDAALSLWENSSVKLYFSADTSWTFTDIGAIGVTGNWEDQTHTVEDIWENSNITLAHAAGTSWSFTGTAVTRDSD